MPRFLEKRNILKNHSIVRSVILPTSFEGGKVAYGTITDDASMRPPSFEGGKEELGMIIANGRSLQ